MIASLPAQTLVRPVNGSSVSCKAKSSTESSGPPTRRILLGGAALAALAALGGKRAVDVSSDSVSVKEKPTSRLVEGLTHFVTGGIAGSVGAAAVYPVDLVKTRLQNDRTQQDAAPRYNNAWECARGVVTEEGIGALYQGLLPQILGVWPEKAVKLSTNDFVRGLFADPVSGAVPLVFQVLAGGSGGLCQVVFTNPLEIVKVRLQVVEANRDGEPPTPWEVVQELGFRGLYKGSATCISRDVPFSMIYFPTFAALKEVLRDPASASASPAALFAAGLLAGVPAAYFVTPADVIKTRIQVDAREGEDVYDGPIDCLKKTVQKEGYGALYKGGVQRVLRSAPQFGVTLLVYELLNRII